MKKILIVTLALFCLANSFAQDTKREKSEIFQFITTAIMDGDSAQYEMIDKFISAYGLTSDALLLQTMQLEAEGNEVEARERLDLAIAKVTSNDVINKATLLNIRVNYCKTPLEKLKYADLAIKADPKDPDSYLKRYQIYKYLELYDEAVKDIKKAVKLTGGDPKLRTELARTYLLADNEKKGMKELDNVLNQYPNLPDARKLRAMVYYYKGNIEPFVDDYLYYLQLTHDFDKSYINPIADTAYDYIIDYANQILNHAMEQEDKAYWEYFEGHIKLYTSRDVEAGLKHLDNALKLTNDSTDLYGRIIALQLSNQLDNNDYDKAMESISRIEELLSRTNDQPAIWITSAKARILVNRKQYQEALLCYSNIIKENSLDSTATAYHYYLMAEIYQDKLGDAQAALANMDSALTYEPGNTSYLYRHARICEKYFKDEAHLALMRADCEKILELDTYPSESSYRHFAFALLGRKAEAEEWLGKIMTEINTEHFFRGLVDYNGACMYSLMGDVYNATRLLMDAMERENCNCDQLKEDADFDNIRETPEFKSIMKIACSDEK